MCGNCFILKKSLVGIRGFTLGRILQVQWLWENLQLPLKPDSPLEDSHWGEALWVMSGKGSAYNRNVIEHQRIHSGQKPHECGERGKDFSGLVVHQRMHTVDKPYEWEKYWKSLSSKRNLIGRQRIRTGEKSYGRNDYSKAFRRRKNIHWTSES